MGDFQACPDNQQERQQDLVDKNDDQTYENDTAAAKEQPVTSATHSHSADGLGIELSELKAMGLCLEADYKRPEVERLAGNFCFVQASTKEVVEAMRSGAFASPGSSLSLYSVVVFSVIINNPGWLQRSERFGILGKSPERYFCRPMY